MKFTLTNLGCITQASFELNDLTIIAGENNTGKTYITYSIYGLLKNIYDYFEYPNSNQLVKELIANGTIKIKHSDLIDSLAQNLKKISDSASKYIPSFFNDKEDIFKNSRINFFVDNICSIENNENIKRRITTNVDLVASSNNDELVISLLMNQADSLPSFILERYFNNILGEVLLKKCLPNSFFILSAERLGISLFYKELDIAKNVMVEMIQKREKNDSVDPNPFDLIENLSARYAIPIRDNISFTRDVENVQKNNSSLEKPEALYKRIESMMRAYYKYKNKEIKFISQARKQNRFEIPIHLASTSARGLMEFYFFLKHIAAPGMLLIIDEPESHLNPKNQIELARLLIACVNAGIKVFFTTHSDYIIKEINNLILLNKEFEGKREFLEKYRFDYNEYDKVDFNKINAYVASNGTLEKCSVNENGIYFPSFENTIDKINEISSELNYLTDIQDVHK